MPADPEVRLPQSVALLRRSEVAEYNPQRGLRTIAVADAAIRHFARAKDATKLNAAVETKIDEQIKYVIWRDGTVERSVEPRRSGRGGRISVLQSNLPDADPGHVVIHRWRKRFFERNGDGRWEPNDEKRRIALEDAQHRCRRVCEQESTGVERGTAGTGEFERYTPKRYVEASRNALGGIDLDPASCAKAQRIVKAKRWFSLERGDDGLLLDWSGRVFLNPPYHRDLAPRFITKLLAELASGRVTAAILLVNNSTDTDWFLDAQAAASAICFTHGRIRFLDQHGSEVMPTQGQAFLYYGSGVERFAEAFADIGFGVTPAWPDVS